MSQRVSGRYVKSQDPVGVRYDTEKTPRPHSKRRSLVWSGLILVLGVACVAGFLYWDRHNQVSNLIRSTGAWGILISIVLMTLFCIIPVPSEFLIVLNMKVFDVWWGTWYSWIGSMLGSIAVFLLARYFGRRLLKPFVSDDRMREVENWVSQRGISGLILVRIVPLPFIVVNYTAGVVKSVSLWNFTWTSAVGGIPYYVGAALVFLGLSKKYLVWLIVGGIAMVVIWTLGFLYSRKSKRVGSARITPTR